MERRRLRDAAGKAPRDQPADQFLGITLKRDDQLHRFDGAFWVVRIASDRKLLGLDLKKGDAFSIDEKERRIQITLRHEMQTGGVTYLSGAVVDIDGAGRVVASTPPQGPATPTTRERVHAVATQLRAMAFDEDKYLANLRALTNAFLAANASSGCATASSTTVQLQASIPKVEWLGAQWRQIADKMDHIADTHDDDYELDDYAIVMRRDISVLADAQADQGKTLASLSPQTDACRRHYPIPILAGHDFGAYHMITRGQLQQSGLLLLETEINEHRALLGDCGKPIVYAYDKDGNQLLRTEGTRSCVDGTHMGWIAGPSVRVVPWQMQIPNVENVAAIVVYHVNDAPPPLEKLNATIAQVRQFAKDNQDVIAVIGAAM
jgi:hypothetical protein